MNDLAKIALPAAIALLGTLGGLIFAYRQSRRRARDEADASYHAEKRAAYKALWERLEDIHGYARGLATDERQLINGYLQHLVELGTSAAAQSSATVQREVYITGPGLSTSDATEFLQLREAFERVDIDRRARARSSGARPRATHLTVLQIPETDEARAAFFSNAC